MEEFYTSLNLTDFVNNTKNISDINSSYDPRAELFIHVMEVTIICIGLPMTLLAMGSVFYQVRKHHVTQIYFINLLISDVIQLCCLTSKKLEQQRVDFFVYYFALMASVGFMVCISLERYLVIAKPLWYRFRQNIKISVIVCVVIWILPLSFVLPVLFEVNIEIPAIVFALFFILPLPLFIFFLVGTLKALSAAISVSADEKRRIVASLVVVLLIYILLYLPGMIWGVKKEARENEIFGNLTYICLCLSPLSDLTLYFFLRKGVVDKILTLLCCCKISNNEQTNSTTNENVSALCLEEV